jgi:hypothetical protein
MTATINLTSEDANAIIDNALLNAQQGIPSTGQVPGESGVFPGPLPTDAPIDENLTPEQKQARHDQEKIKDAQGDMLGEEQAAALAEEQAKQAEREKTLIGIGEKLLNQSKAAASGAGVKIAGIPTPGNLVTPLTLLVLFFFILILYNGHTRLQWLWLVLTNNAYVSTNAPGGGTGGGPPVPAQEMLIGAIASLPAFTPTGMSGGNPYS